MKSALAALSGAVLLALLSPAFGAPPDAVDQRGLMTLLKDHMSGQPVIAVGVGDVERGVHFDEAAYAKESKTLGRLQAISAAVSADTETYIPYLVRGAWVIAPETRKEVRADLTGLPDVQAEGGGLLLDQVVLSLAPDLLQAAGSDAGIPATRLSRDAQAMLALALKPPIKITKTHDGVWTDPNGYKHEGWVYDPVGQITEPLDLSQVRLRARLWIAAASVSIKVQGQEGWSIQRLGQQRSNKVAQLTISGWRNVEAPVETLAANRFKPSDLDGKRYTMPFGASGVMSVREALQRLEKVTGLKLYPGAYGRAPAFVGSPTVTCGEVLDGLRLAITGAWRKVGKGYVLCWDRRGIAALNQMLAETSQDIASRINEVVSDTKKSSGWLDIAMKMPFAPNDPLALTDEERRKVYADPPAPRDGEPRQESGEGIPFEEMTPEQQSYLEECGKTDQMALYPTFEPGMALPDPEHRPFTTDDVRSARLGRTPFAPNVALEFNLPGFGWVRQVLDHGQSLEPYKISSIRQEAANRKAQSGQEPPGDATTTPPQPPPGTFAPKPFTIAAPDRGVMVGPMRGEAVNALAGQMKAKRFTTLFYPVLFDGYATFPNRAFPEHPALKGENGMAAAVAAAKSHGIKLIGYLSPIAWRSERNATHWLDKHPDWLDRDPLGRTRLQWLKDPAIHKTFLPSGEPDDTRRDYVRPTEPEVSRRLETLVDDFARTSSAGMMLLDWRTQQIKPRDITLSPPLGFALGDRIAALDKTGFDPLDTGLTRYSADTVFVYPPDSRLLGRFTTRGAVVDDTGDPEPYAALVDRLFLRAKSLRKDWITYLVQDPTAMLDSLRFEEPGATPPKRTPKADRLLANLGPGTAPDGMIVPDMSWEEASSGDWVPDEARGHSFLLYFDWSEKGLSRNAKMVVMDFRLRPSSIAEVMKYVR